MKKTLSILLALLMVFSVVLTGCTAGETAKTGENGEPVATETETVEKTITMKIPQMKTIKKKMV